MTSLVSRWWRTLRERGALAATRAAVQWAQRTGERRFDARIGIETTGRVDVRELAPGCATAQDAGHAVHYSPIPVRRFRAAMCLLPLLTRSQWTFVDIGCGKGRALLLAAEAGFGHCVGVDLFPQLCDVATANVAAWRTHTSLDTPIEIVVGDACALPRPQGNVVYFLYNPFDEVVMRPFAESVARRHPPGNRTVILYANPVYASVFDRDDRFAAIARSAHAAVYEATDAATTAC